MADVEAGPQRPLGPTAHESVDLGRSDQRSTDRRVLEPGRHDALPVRQGNGSEAQVRDLEQASAYVHGPWRSRSGPSGGNPGQHSNQSRRRWRHLFQREIDRWHVRARIRARAGRQSGGPGVRRDDSESGAAGQCGPVWTLAWAASSGLRDGSRLGQRLQPGIARRPAMVVFNNHRRRRAGLGQGRNGRAFGPQGPQMSANPWHPARLKSVRQNLSAAEAGTRHGKCSSAAGPATIGRALSHQN